MRLNPKYLQALALLGVGTAFSIAGSFGSFHDLKKGEICTPLRCSVRIVPAWIPTSGEAIAIRQGDGAQMLGLSFAGFVFTGGALACFLRGREEEREYLEEEAEVKAQIAQGKRLENQQQAHWARMAEEVERHRASRWAAEEIHVLQPYGADLDEEPPLDEAPALPHGDPGTLDEEIRQGKLDQPWLDNFIRQTALVWGNQGSGKSWMLRYLAKRKVEAGYKLVVLDPHSNRVEWKGAQGHFTYDAIAEFIEWYVDELISRYEAFSRSDMTEEAWRKKLWQEGKAMAIVADEVTTYADMIDDQGLLSKFFKLALTASRKQEMPVTFASHNNTQEALGKITGLGNLIKKMLQLELETTLNKKGDPIASGRGMMKRDGSNEWVPVTLPQVKKKITQFSPRPKPDPNIRKRLEWCLDNSPSAEQEHQRKDNDPENLTQLGDYLIEKLKPNEWVVKSKLQSQAWKVRDWEEDTLEQVLTNLVTRQLLEVEERGKVVRVRRVS